MMCCNSERAAVIAKVSILTTGAYLRYENILNQHLLFPELKQDHPAKKLKILLFKMCWVKMFSYLKYAPVVKIETLAITAALSELQHII